ncbi:LOW QUALITY PROTEIN: MTR1A-like protein [Mya arenaria]|uniref:MTR1A-like protein n=1 Tax=Mya arenaria TaxID=6604 RepID=A0ABY7GC48_MYAAR|nr:LOW QUALITY PROTEIN: MTR1A-like protein [Mya arenaria]
MENITYANVSVQMNTASDGSLGRHAFLTSQPYVAVSCIIIQAVASLAGTFGNVLILFVIATKSELRNKMESTFIANLALSDMYVTLIAGPMSLLDRRQSLHDILRDITNDDFNDEYKQVLLHMRKCFLQQNLYQEKLYRHVLYFVGTALVLLNTLGIGDHGFDQKSLECIWDRMATYPYTIVFSIVLVWIPSIITGINYLRIYLFVRAHRQKLIKNSIHSIGNMTQLKSVQLAKTLFIIYAVFVTCWAPYALLIVVDTKDTFPHEVHIYITTFAHLHPSLNWVIYFCTNKQFAKAYREIFTSYCRALPLSPTSE